MKKKCAIIISAFQSQDYIIEAIDSLKNQILPNNWEITFYIGVDGCKETAAVLQQNSIEFYYSPINVGTYIITNSLLNKAAVADLFLRFDSDDVADQNFLYYGILNGYKYGISRPHWIRCDQSLTPVDNNLKISWGVVFFRKDIIDILGGYHHFRVSSDAGLIRRINQLKIFADESNTNCVFFRRTVDNSLTNKLECGIKSQYRNSILKEIDYFVKEKNYTKIFNPMTTELHYINNTTHFPNDSSILFVICFKWGDKFSSHYVNVLYRSLKKYLKKPFKFICYTDDVKGIDQNVDCRALFNDHADLGKNYRKLKIYDRNILSEFNYNILVLDLDNIICGDITFLADLKQNTIWKAPSNGIRGWVYNSSVVRVVDKQFSDMYDQFITDRSYYIHQSREINQWLGTDQAIISNFFDGKINTVTEKDGLVSFRDHQKLLDTDQLSSNIKLISFYQSTKYGKPCQDKVKNKYPWVRKHWTNYITKEEQERILDTPSAKTPRQPKATGMPGLSREERLERRRRYIEQIRQRQRDRLNKQP